MTRKYDPLESMMMDIVDFGEEQIWIDIEMISNPISRAKEKGLYYEANKRLAEKSKGKDNE